MHVYQCCGSGSKFGPYTNILQKVYTMHSCGSESVYTLKARIRIQICTIFWRRIKTVCGSMLYGSSPNLIHILTQCSRCTLCIDQSWGSGSGYRNKLESGSKSVFNSLLSGIISIYTLQQVYIMHEYQSCASGYLRRRKKPYLDQCFIDPDPNLIHIQYTLQWVYIMHRYQSSGSGSGCMEAV